MLIWSYPHMIINMIISSYGYSYDHILIWLFIWSYPNMIIHMIISSYGYPYDHILIWLSIWSYPHHKILQRSQRCLRKTRSLITERLATSHWQALKWYRRHHHHCHHHNNHCYHHMSENILNVKTFLERNLAIYLYTWSKFGVGLVFWLSYILHCKYVLYIEFRSIVL